MKPWVTLADARTPDGSAMTLRQRDDELAISIDGIGLMSSRMRGSEEALARVGCAVIKSAAPVVLVGGLGLGFTLRAALDLLPASAQVEVAELIPAVVEWNRTYLAHLAGRPLEDTRVKVHTDDVQRVLALERGRYDAILLDVDNGPDAFSTSSNATLYSDAGLMRCRSALNESGTLAIWSAFSDPAFEKRLRRLDWAVSVENVRARGASGGPRHCIFVARRGA